MQLSVHTTAVVAEVATISGHSQLMDCTQIQHPVLFVECITEVGRIAKVETMEIGCGITFARLSFQ